MAFLVMSSDVCAQKTYHGDGPDDVLRWLPAASVYALKATGVETSSTWRRLAVNSATSYALTIGTTWVLKQAVHERRPDWTDRRSFPSGHASVAFAGAVMVDKELRRVSPWLPAVAYAVAAGVAIDRVARNRHHWQDVCAGAALGAGCTVVGYWLGDKISGEHSRFHMGIGAESISLMVKL